LGERGFFLRENCEILKKRLVCIAKEILSRDASKIVATPEELKHRLAPAPDDAPFERMPLDLSKEGKLAKTSGGSMFPYLVLKLP